MNIKIKCTCEHSSMLISSKIEVERSSSFSLNGMMSIGLITCLHFDTIMLYIWKHYLQKLQCQTVVGQELVAINDLQIPIYMHFLVKL